HAAFGVGLLTISCFAIRKQALFHDGEFQRVAETTVVIGEHRDLPALFADPLDLMPVALFLRQVRGRCRLLEPDLTQQPPTAKDLFVRHVMGNVTRFYDITRWISPEEARALPDFLYVPSQERKVQLDLPGNYKITPFNGWIGEVRRE